MDFQSAQTVTRRRELMLGAAGGAVSVQRWQRVLGNQAVGQLLAKRAGRSAAASSTPGTVPRMKAARAPAAVLARLIQRIVTQISPSPDRPDVIGEVLIIGRPARAYSGTMGDHSTAFAAQVDSVRLRLVRRTHVEAIAGMDELVHSMVELPGFHYIQQLPDEQGEKVQRAWKHLETVRKLLPATGTIPKDQRTVLHLQEYVNAYLDMRELIPFSTMNIRAKNPSLAGKGKGEAGPASILAANEQDRTQPAELIRAALLDLFDSVSSALVASELEDDMLGKMAPGMSGMDLELRIKQFAAQHMVAIFRAYPNAFRDAGVEPDLAMKELITRVVGNMLTRLRKERGSLVRDKVSLRDEIVRQEAQLPTLRKNATGQRRTIQTIVEARLEDIKYVDDTVGQIDALVKKYQPKEVAKVIEAPSESSSDSESESEDDSDEAEEAVDEAEAAEVRKQTLATQIRLDDKGLITEILSGGRSPSPFSGTMGAHSTSWIVHLDRIRGALATRTLAKALQIVRDELVPEAETNATKLAKRFPAEKSPYQAELATTALAALKTTGAGIDALAESARASVLQTYINQLLTYINYTPGATLEAADTGGKNEGRHRGVVQGHESGKQTVDKPTLQNAILGLLDVKEASPRQQVVLLKNHLRIIGKTYPTAYAGSGLASFEHGSLLKRIELKAEGDGSGSKKRKRPAAKKKAPGKRTAGQPPAKRRKLVVPTGAALAKPTWTPDFTPFGSPGTFVSLLTRVGFGAEFFKPLLSSSPFVTFDERSFTFGATLGMGSGSNDLVDTDGGIPDAALPKWLAAYRRDVEHSTAYLTEAEGHTAAQYLGLGVSVFRGATPPKEWRRVENPSDGNCLLHSLVQAWTTAKGRGTPARATQSQITELRRAIAAGLQDDDIIALCAAAIVARTEGTPEAGLGPNVRGLLGTINFEAVRASRRATTTEVRAARGEPAHVPAKGSGGTGATLAMPQLGTARAEDDVAILHTSAAHYVMLERIPAPKAVVAVGGPSGDGDVDMTVVT